MGGSVRLSHVSGTPKYSGQGQLEVWSAQNNIWNPVCGVHWSPDPMSHQACHMLGYSRANETLIRYGPTQKIDYSSIGDATVTVSNRLTHQHKTERTIVLHNDTNKQQMRLRQRYNNVSNGETTTMTNIDVKRLVSNSTLSPINESLSFQSSEDDSDDYVANEDKLHSTNTRLRHHHHVTYERRPNVNVPDVTNKQHPETSHSIYSRSIYEESRETIRINSQQTNKNPSLNKLNNLNRFKRYNYMLGNNNNREQEEVVNMNHGVTSEAMRDMVGNEQKWFKSLSNMLYHGATIGCQGKRPEEQSAVLIQCENFQCGRSVISYTSRYHHPIVSHIEQQTISSDNNNNNSSSNSTIVKVTTSARSIVGVDKDDGDDHETATNINHYNDDKIDDSDNDLNIDSSPQFRPGVSSRFVVGGIESLPGEFPYLGALHGGPDEVFFCGGVLISANWLLTAAHCVGNRTQPNGWMVKVGVTRRTASPSFVRKLKVRKIIKHQDFNRVSLFNNDIALLLLEESVEFHQYLRPICLPRANIVLGPENSNDCVVVGFGKSRYSQEADYLHVAHFAKVPIVKHSICSKWYGDQDVYLTKGMLCAGYAEGKLDACQVSNYIIT